jgi:hypothetical protein
MTSKVEKYINANTKLLSVDNFDRSFFTCLDISDEKSLGVSINPISNKISYVVIKNDKTYNFDNFKKAFSFYQMKLYV